jgi:hypothetical protein
MKQIYFNLKLDRMREPIQYIQANLFDIMDLNAVTPIPNGTIMITKWKMKMVLCALGICSQKNVAMWS